MKQTIEFKKTCIMKTYVEEVTDITVTHDYKIEEDTVEGYFDIVGRYKVTKASVNDEDFMFTVPFTIALSAIIDKDSINLTMKDFEYSVEKDLLHLNMKLDMEYSELATEPEEDTLEDEINEEIEKMNMEEEENMDNMEMPVETKEKSAEEMETPNVEIEENKMENEEELNITLEDNEVDTKKEIKNILSGFNEENSYFKYKIYIMKEEDTIESVAIKYDVTLEDLKEYNNLEEIKSGDKIIIPKPNEE